MNWFAVGCSLLKSRLNKGCLRPVAAVQEGGAAAEPLAILEARLLYDMRLLCGTVANPFQVSGE